MENDNLRRELDQVRQRTDKLEVDLTLKTQSESMKDEAAQKTERTIKSLEIETAQRAEELQATKESLDVLKSRSAAFEKIGEETDAEIVSLLRRAQEAESWQAIIREGLAKVMKVHSDEPFEQTWQKMEDILQSSVFESTTGDAFRTDAQDAKKTCTVKDRDLLPNPGENKTTDTFQAELSKRLCQTGEFAQAGEALSTNICSSSKSLEHDEFVDSLPKFPTDRGQIVPFSNFHDINSRENSLSLFNDPAELEMLMMSTPDLQGSLASRPTVSNDVPEGIQRVERFPDEDNKEVEKKSDAILTHPPVEPESIMSEWNKSALAEFDDPLAVKSEKSEPSNTKRKMVSFEATRVNTQTEVGRTRRMSDATDNSSGQESESKSMKRTQKRTYSRLRQSVTQEETFIESGMSMNVDSGNQNLAESTQRSSIEKTEDSSAIPKPPKRSRNAADRPARRLSPKGLASGSSRSNATSQAANARGRTKRRTRGKISTSFLTMAYLAD
jgi:hypothetical protein